MVKVEELVRMRNEQVQHQLIDIREPYEAEICNIGGDLIPMSELLDHATEIKTDIPVIIHCKSGKRAAAAVDALNRRGFTNVHNLEGGIMAWIEQIDTSLEVY
jgi:rhodanese-related sulfurtransferase